MPSTTLDPAQPTAAAAAAAAAADPPFRTISYLPTEAAYDRWADVYDTDGNFLQALDTRELGSSGLLRWVLGVAGITSKAPGAGAIAGAGAGAAAAKGLPGQDHGDAPGGEQNSGQVGIKGFHVIDLGCGTGRVTYMLWDLLGELRRAGDAEMAEVKVTGLDSSEGMLAVARRKRAAAGRSGSLERGDASNERSLDGDAMLQEEQATGLAFLRADIDDIASLSDREGPAETGLTKDTAKPNISVGVSTNNTSPTATSSSSSTTGSLPTISRIAHSADLIISALVLEHISLPTFFRAATNLLKLAPTSSSSSPAATTSPSPNHPPPKTAYPHILLTNMHPEMGHISQAGFIDASTGEKVRPRSHAHSVEEVRAEAERRGFVVCGEWEREVRAEDVEGLGARSGKWVGVKCWFGLVLRFEGKGR